LPEPPALRAGHLLTGAGRDVPDVGAVCGLGIPWITEHLAIVIERMYVTFPGAVHVDMLSHPSA